MPTVSPIRPATHATKIRHHPPIAAGALIHMGAIMAARQFEKKFGITDSMGRTLTYSACTLGATYITHWLCERNRQEERTALRKRQ
jgi:hypothetical protein